MTFSFIFIEILVLIAFSSCNIVQRRGNPITLVDIEANKNNMYQINLSQFTDDIHYLPLEMVKDHPLVWINEFDFLENLILVPSINACLLYNNEGRFITNIGKKGRGPGEYQYLDIIGFGKNKHIYIKSVYDLFEYNLDGSFVKKYKNCFLINDKDYLSNGFLVNDSMFFGHIPNSTGQKEYKALIIDNLGHVKHYYRNYILFNREQAVASSFEGHAHIYKFKNEIFYKELFNDTLFSLTSDYELKPRYVFNLGKFKEPVSERAKSKFEKDVDYRLNYMYLYYVFQTDNYLFLYCQFGNLFPAKRLTSFTPIPGGKSVWYSTTNVLGIFNKKTRELVFSKPTSTDNLLYTTGLYNDLDAGPRFFPQAMINDSTMLMVVTVNELKNHIASSDFKNNGPKFPEKKEELEKLANSMTETDNPILMMVRLKK